MRHLGDNRKSLRRQKPLGVSHGSDIFGRKLRKIQGNSAHNY
jgi:hypothetical protein